MQILFVLIYIEKELLCTVQYTPVIGMYDVATFCLLQSFLHPRRFWPWGILVPSLVCVYVILARLKHLGVNFNLIKGQDRISIFFILCGGFKYLYCVENKIFYQGSARFFSMSKPVSISQINISYNGILVRVKTNCFLKVKMEAYNTIP